MKSISFNEDMKPSKISKDKQRCSVLECPSSRREKSHRFPIDKNVGMKWIEATGNLNFQELTYRQIHDKKYCICWKNFQKHDYLYGVRSKLREGVIPILLLPGHKKSASCKKTNYPKIDLEVKENSPTAINVTPTAKQFTPMNYTNWIAAQSGNITSCRRCSLLASGQLEEDNISEVGSLTPKSSRKNSDQIFTSTPKAHNEKLPGKLFSEFDPANMQKILDQEGSINSNSTSSLGHDGMFRKIKSERYSPNIATAEKSLKPENVECSDFSQKKKSPLLSRPSKRIMQNATDLYENTLKMYEHVH